MQEYENRENSQGKRMGYICLALAVFIIVLAIAFIVLGYFISFKDGEGEIRDGLYRLLDMENLPRPLSFLPQWAGYIWLIIDCLILLGMIVLIDRLFVKSKVYFTGVKNVDF